MLGVSKALFLYRSKMMVSHTRYHIGMKHKENKSHSKKSWEDQSTKYWHHWELMEQVNGTTVSS